MLKERQLLKKIVPFLKSPEAIIITGIRRCGKTSLLRLIYDRINSENKIFLDMENPLNRKYFEETNYERVKSSFEALGIDFTKKAYIFCDEIQFVKNLPSVAKYFIDRYRVKFFLTGSASFYLKNLFTESLAGRKYIFELFPLNFSEFLFFKDVNLKLPVNSRKVTPAVFETLNHLYDEYVTFGGFPQVVLKSSVKEKKKSLEDIFTSLFQMEVVQLGDFHKNEAVRDLMLLLLQRVGSLLDINKISKETGLSRPTISNYLSFLEGIYFIKRVKPMSFGRDTEIRKAAKIYACDSGFLNFFARLDRGRIFENNIFQNLRTKGEVNYWRRKSGYEVDFILNRKIAYEVKLTPSQADVKKLAETTRLLKLKKFRIISKNFAKLPHITYGFML